MRLSLATIAVTLLSSQLTLGTTTISDQKALSVHANMTSTGSQDPRVSLGDIKLELMHNRADESQSFLDEMLMYHTNCDVHSYGCWGYYVVRICFGQGDDERISKAMLKLEEAIALYIKQARQNLGHSDPNSLAADEDVLRRFHNTLIDDEKLRGANISEIRDYLENWFASFASLPEEQRGARFRSFILLDAQVLDNLDKLTDIEPIEPPRALYREKDFAWVKLVDVDEEEGETCRVWIWDLVRAFRLLGHLDCGVSSMPRGWGPIGEGEEEGDVDWMFYEPI